MGGLGSLLPGRFAGLAPFPGRSLAEIINCTELSTITGYDGMEVASGGM